MGLREWYSYSVFGIPHGPPGWIGARMMASMKGKYFRSMTVELDPQADDELLDVGCGSGTSGTRDAWGIRCWTDADAQRLVEEAGFTDVTVSVLPVISRPQLIRAVKPASSVIDETSETTAPQKEVVS